MNEKYLSDIYQNLINIYQILFIRFRLSDLINLWRGLPGTLPWNPISLGPVIYQTRDSHPPVSFIKFAPQAKNFISPYLFHSPRCNLNSLYDLIFPAFHYSAPPISSRVSQDTRDPLPDQLQPDPGPPRPGTPLKSCSRPGTPPGSLHPWYNRSCIGNPRL